MLLNPLDPWVKGDPIAAWHLDQGRQALDQMACFLGGVGIDVFGTLGGRVMQVQPSQRSAPPFYVYIAGAEAGFGAYRGYRVDFTTTAVSGSTNVTNNLLGIDNTRDEMLVWNMAEINGPGHALTDGSTPTWQYFLAVPHPAGLTDTQGRPVVLIHAFDIFLCSNEPEAGAFGAY